MARPAGVEPATSGLEVPRSIQLSYGRPFAALSEIVGIGLQFQRARAKRHDNDRASLCGHPGGQSIIERADDLGKQNDSYAFGAGIHNRGIG